MTTLFARARGRCLTLALSSVALLGPAAVQAAEPLPVSAVHYGSTVDLGAGMAHFTVQFDRLPDLLTVDAYFRQADSFQFWTDTVSADPIQSTFAGIGGLGPLGTQTVLAASDIPLDGKMRYIWPQDASYTGPRDRGGWGSVRALGDYALGPDNSVAFDVPLSVLRAAADGKFYYGFETYQYGSWAGIDYFGEAGKEYTVGCVPEPSAPAMLTAGLALAAVLRRRRR